MSVGFWVNIYGQVNSKPINGCHDTEQTDGQTETILMTLSYSVAGDI
jgi:hypothetical protein